MYGDGATIKRMPLVNILASGAYIHTALLEIRDTTSHMEVGGKKDARYFASLFRVHIDEFESEYPNTVDYCTFDGAANVQKAGEVLQAHYPRIVCTHGAEHVISLFFQDCFHTPVLQTLSKICKKAYAVFGSGSMHGPYAIFQKISKMHNVVPSGWYQNGWRSNRFPETTPFERSNASSTECYGANKAKGNL